jgi:hypothetical protein
VQFKLALLSQFPDSYTGDTANISAAGTGGSCVEAPSTRLSLPSVSVQQPGAGLCSDNGLRPAGQYSLTQDTPPNTSFVRYEVYNATTGDLIQNITTPSGTFNLNGDITVVAVYSVPGLPSPSPAASPRYECVRCRCVVSQQHCRRRDDDAMTR